MKKGNRKVMRVLQVITKGETGGAQSHVLALCASLRGRVDFIVLIGGVSEVTTLGRQMNELEIPVVRIPSLNNSMNPITILRSIRHLIRISRMYRPDILHAHSAIAGAVARIAGFITHIPVIYTVHGFGFKPEIPFTRRVISFVVEATVAPFTHRFICVSAHERLLGRFLPAAKSKFLTIHNGIPDTAFRSQSEQTPVSAIMVARLDEPKRHDILLEALRKFRELNGFELPTTVLGDGPAKPRLTAMAKRLGLECVVFPGNRTDVAELLACHQIFVLVSDYEAFPISIIEAMRAKMAIVASRLPGTAELIEDNQSGILVRNNPEDIARQLSSLCSSTEHRRRLGEKARARYQADFQATAMSSGVYAVYTTCGTINI